MDVDSRDVDESSNHPVSLCSSLWSQCKAQSTAAIQNDSASYTSTHTHTLSLSLSHIYLHTLTHTLTLTHTHLLIHTLTHTHTYSCSLPPPLPAAVCLDCAFQLFRNFSFVAPEVMFNTPLFPRAVSLDTNARQGVDDDSSGARTAGAASSSTAVHQPINFQGQFPSSARASQSYWHPHSTLASSLTTSHPLHHTHSTTLTSPHPLHILNSFDPPPFLPTFSFTGAQARIAIRRRV